MLEPLRRGRDRFWSWFDKLAASRRSRVVVAVMVTLFHLAMFDCAGHRKLDLPFNDAPGEKLYYSDINFTSTIGVVRQPHHWSRLIVSRWDAEHYIGFAVRGLQSCPKDGAPGPKTDWLYLQCGLGWQPAYGLVGGVVSRATSIPPDYTLLIISILATILANLLWTSAPFVKRLGDRESLGALIAFNAFPSAFYLTTPYTEAAAMALALGAFVAICNERWILAGFLVGASTALRTAAVAFSAGFGLAAVYAAYRRKKSGDPKWWKPLLGIPLCGWSMAVQMLALKISVGDAFAYVRARHSYGDKHDYFRIFSPTFIMKAVTSMHMDGVVLIASIAIIALTVREATKRLGAAPSIYLVGASAVGLELAATVLSEGTWGLNRYMLMCPITFCCAGVLLRKYPVVFALWIVLSLGMYYHVELCSYITHGNPELCPCLGHVQFAWPFQS